jgi:hypothetical protein
VGGICGFTYGGKFSRCDNNGEVFATHSVGGILGALEPTKTTEILTCVSAGNLNFFATGGGIIGDIEGSDNANAEVRISECNVSIEEAKIYGTSTSPSDIYSAGGFIGRATTSSLIATNYGKVTLSSSETHFSYRSPDDAENMVVNSLVGFNKEISPSKTFVDINTEKITEELTRLGNIE